MTKSKEAQEQATAVQGPIILPEFADEYRKAQRALTKAVKDHLRMATEHQAVHKAQEAVRAEQAKELRPYRDEVLKRKRAVSSIVGRSVTEQSLRAAMAPADADEEADDAPDPQDG